MSLHRITKPWFQESYVFLAIGELDLVIIEMTELGATERQVPNDEYKIDRTRS